MSSSLNGKVALITGSSKGLGKKMAETLAEKGVKVVITYTSEASVAKAEEVASSIQKIHSSTDKDPIAINIRADLREASSPRTIVDETVRAFGHIDIIVNNAGSECTKYIPEITADDFYDIFHLNVRAPHLLVQAALPHLRAQARIINLSSVAARLGLPEMSMYNSSKAAVGGLTRCWAAELGKYGTTVNAVAPGPTESRMIYEIPKAIVDSQKAGTPLENRLGWPEEIADVVAWLASDAARWVTGQVICASGGMSMY